MYKMSNNSIKITDCLHSQMIVHMGIVTPFCKGLSISLRIKLYEKFLNETQNKLVWQLREQLKANLHFELNLYKED